MHNEGNLILALTRLMIIKTMMTIGKDREPPPSETFSYEEERYQRRKRKSLSPKGLGHDAMSRTLDKSPFTRHIEGAMLPQRFQ